VGCALIAVIKLPFINITNHNNNYSSVIVRYQRGNREFQIIVNEKQDDGCIEGLMQEVTRQLIWKAASLQSEVIALCL
jgi:hypothetical protein